MAVVVYLEFWMLYLLINCRPIDLASIYTAINNSLPINTRLTLFLSTVAKAKKEKKTGTLILIYLFFSFFFFFLFFFSSEMPVNFVRKFKLYQKKKISFANISKTSPLKPLHHLKCPFQTKTITTRPNRKPINSLLNHPSIPHLFPIRQCILVQHHSHITDLFTTTARNEVAHLGESLELP